MIEAGTDAIDTAVATTRAAMAEASRIVLGGLEIATDAEIVTYPDRYLDPSGAVMWQRVTDLLEARKVAEVS